MYISIDSRQLKNIKRSESYEKHAKPLIEHSILATQSKEIVNTLNISKKQQSPNVRNVQDSSFRSPISDCLSSEAQTNNNNNIEKQTRETVFLAFGEF